ncbi:hypothetical protein CKM354_000910000 [Cercospora kikuchii]|uniref:BTB domain-containing protein n=1 Tax=Cercospora kikuchii TaxID=84275 RepID=A0A9P3CUH4_9PEZI|nr:uncharacterized protein CKM354_000910000 [Cercospora kikuchii]GIZ45955.1 hypothetical protein CKM354_000910000 [Cercospora kikuchii]
MATVHEVSSEGDVKLICGSEEAGDAMHIIVSSVIMRHGSPVFKAMLGSDFKEGCTLSTGARLDLPLPDDHARSMLTICQIMHLHPKVHAPCNCQEMLKLAMLIDKYDCRGPLSYPVSVWMRDRMICRIDSDRVHLFASAYTLGLSVDFTRLGEELVQLSDPRFPPERISGIDQDLQTAIDTLGRHADTLRSDARMFLDNIIKSECAGERKNDLYDWRVRECGPNGCNYVSKRFNSFMKVMIESELWPITAFMEKSVLHIIGALRRFPSGWSNIPGKPCGTSCKRDYMKTDEQIVSEMKDMADDMEFATVKPCLVCVKSGGMQERGHCEETH